MDILNKYKSELYDSINNDNIIDDIIKLICNYKDTNIYSTTLLLGKSGCGKSYLLKKIFLTNKNKFELINIDITKLKELTKNNFVKKKYEQILVDYLKKYYFSTNILSYFTDYNYHIKILYIDENINQVFKNSIKKLVIDLININNKYKICPLIIIFNDVVDQYVKQYKNNTNVIYINQPSVDNLYKFVDKLITRENIILPNKDNNLYTLCKLSHNNYNLLINNLLYLFNDYLEYDDVTKYITQQSFDKYLMSLRSNKYIYDNITLICKRCLNNELSIDDSLKIFYKEKSMFVDNITNYIIKGCKSDDSYKKMTKLLTYNDYVNDIIYKNQKWGLIKHYGFLTCVSSPTNFKSIERDYIFKKNQLSMYKVHKERNYIFYSVFRSSDCLNNLYISQILYHMLKNNKPKFKQIVNFYKLKSQDILYIFKINKFSYQYKLSNSDLLYIKNISDIEEYRINKKNI